MANKSNIAFLYRGSKLLSAIFLVISWRSVLLVEETRVPRENHWPASHWQTSSTNVGSISPPHERCSNSQP